MQASPLPSQVGSWQILGDLGPHPDGALCHARSDTHTRAVILLLHAPLSPQPQRVARLRDLRHPNIVGVLDCCLQPPAIVLEPLEGELLSARLLRGDLDWRRVVAGGRGLLRGIMEAHQQGIFLGHLRPEDVVISRDGRWLSLGWALPQTASVANTQADVYAVGQLLRALLGEGAPPRALADVITRATEADVRQRYATAAELERALDMAQRSAEKAQEIPQTVQQPPAPVPPPSPAAANKADLRRFLPYVGGGIVFFLLILFISALLCANLYLRVTYGE